MLNNIRLKVEEIKFSKTKLDSSDIMRSLRNKRCEVNFLNNIRKDFSTFELSEQLTGKIIEQYKSISYLLNITKPLHGQEKFILPPNFEMTNESQQFIFINILSPLISSVKSILDEHNHIIYSSLNNLRKLLMYMFLISSCYQILAQITLTKTVAFIARKSKVLLQIFLEIPD